VLSTILCLLPSKCNSCSQTSHQFSHQRQKFTNYFSPCFICIAGPSQSPVIAANDDSYSIKAVAGTTTSKSFFVLQNDTGSGSLTLVDVTPAPAGNSPTGRVQISADKQAIEYAVDYSGKPFTEAFRYRVRDESGATSSARLQVSVGESPCSTQL
jgi:hypothetical protein